MSTTIEGRDLAGASGPTTEVLSTPSSSSRPGRWQRGLAWALGAVWLALTVIAWGGGTKQVSLEQLEQDLASGEVKTLAVTTSLDGSRWWQGMTTDDNSSGGGAHGGIIVYATSREWVHQRSVVMPPSAERSVVSQVEADRARWGEAEPRVTRLVEDAKGIPAYEVMPQAVDLVSPLAVGTGVAALLMLCTRRSRRASGWYWFWLVLLLPAGLGVLAYLRSEYLGPTAGVAREPRDSGWAGLAVGLLGAAAIAIVGAGLASLLGISVRPR